MVVLPQVEASAGVDAATNGNVNSNSDVDVDDEFDEDMLVKETIAAGRGDRDEQGVRDQWLSDKHLGGESVYDSRKPVSEEVKRLLDAYRLKCDGCGQKEAVKKVNAYVKETKRLNKLAREKAAAAALRDSWARKIFAALVVAGLSAAYVYQKELGLEFLFQDIGRKLGGGNSNNVDEAQRSEFLRQKRQQAVDAAAERNKPQEAKSSPPTWLANEQKEVWTPKQEKQFQKAAREFSGIPKKERYKLIAEKVVGKSRIECLTHHKMQELLAKYNQEQQQQ